MGQGRARKQPQRDTHRQLKPNIKRKLETSRLKKSLERVMNNPQVRGVVQWSRAAAPLAAKAVQQLLPPRHRTWVAPTLEAGKIVFDRRREVPMAVQAARENLQKMAPIEPQVAHPPVRDARRPTEHDIARENRARLEKIRSKAQPVQSRKPMSRYRSR